MYLLTLLSAKCFLILVSIKLTTMSLNNLQQRLISKKGKRDEMDLKVSFFSQKYKKIDIIFDKISTGRESSKSLLMLANSSLFANLTSDLSSCLDVCSSSLFFRFPSIATNDNRKKGCEGKPQSYNSFNDM